MDRFFATLSRRRIQCAPRSYDKLSRISLGIYIAMIPTVLLALVSRLSPAFSDAYNRTVGQALRFVFAKLTSWLPFSLAEAMLLLSPLLLTLLIIHAVRHRSATWRRAGIYILEVLGGACVFLILFVWNFGAGYHGATIDTENKLDLERTKVSAEELYQTALILREQVNEEAVALAFREQSFSVMPYSNAEMNDKLLDAYEAFCGDYDFISSFRSRVKPVMLSEAMSYTHITGVYSYFTGEANLNIAFPDYTLPYTAAHEMAHQRGIAREDEANFVAFLVCIASDDAYIRYSGYLNLYDYVASALYRADKDLYYELLNGLSTEVRYELRAYSDFFDKYRDSVASEVSGAVNNTYLQMQGTQGTRSYGLVVDLAVAYYKK